MTRFVNRAAWAGFAVAVAAGLGAALVTCALAVVLLQRADDRRLLDAGGVLATELRERPADADLVAVLADETHETSQMGLAFALFDLTGARRAGDARLSFLSAGACTSTEDRRACAVAAGDLLVVVGGPQASRGAPLVTAALLSALAVALLASLAVRPLARSFSAPLTLLSERLATVPVEALTSADLGAPTSLIELEALRTALRTLLTRVDVSLRQAHRFATNAAHELRTPLTALKAELELALEGPLTREAVSLAHDRAAVLATMVERLLVLATPSDAPLTGVAVSLDELVEDTIAALSHDQRARLTFERRAPFTVDGDEALLSMLVSNALSNALKFARHVHVVVEPGALVVTDDGPGVAEADLAHLFEPLYRGQNAHGVEGHGLGLALIAHVARRHGATASLSNVVTGACLRVEFPHAE